MLKVTNEGAGAEGTLVLCQGEALAGRMAHIEVDEGDSGKDGKGPVQRLARPRPVAHPGAPAGVSCVETELAAPLAAGASTVVEVFQVYTQVLQPFPAEARQTEVGRVTFEANLYLVSPYPVESQHLAAKLPLGKVESMTEVEPFELSTLERRAEQVMYGPYGRQKPFKGKKFQLHFVYDHPLVYTTKLTREVVVSHWAGITVRDDVSQVNGAPALTGSYERHWTWVQSPSKKSLKTLTVQLPDNAHDLQYKDNLGNISVSTVLSDAKSTLLNYSPRYPMEGGWKAEYFLKHSVDLAQFVTANGAAHTARIPMFPVFVPASRTTIEELELRVVLPEGAAVTGVSGHLPGMEEGRDTKYSYFDTVGRTVVVLTASNVVAEHAGAITVEYSFNPALLAKEPAMIAAAILLVLATVWAVSAIDLPLVLDDEWRSRKAGKARMGLAAKVAVLAAKRDREYKGMDSALHALMQDADCGAARAARRKRCAALEALMGGLQGAAGDLEGMGKEGQAIAAKVLEILQLEEEKYKVYTALYDAKVQWTEEANDDDEFVEDREREQSLKGLREEIAAQLLELTR